jgi:poly-gamma-glutamate synthesis protein (capsule biosynthesis protein)
MYFASVDPLTGKLVYLQMTPAKVKHFKVNRSSKDNALILRDILNRRVRNLEIM